MKLTPAMRQYMDVKEQHPDCLVLFRMGDFYECFYEDAHEVSTILGITLTSRGKDETKAPLAGIPYHALDKYLKQLVQAGKKIALCEQIEDPKEAKGIVKRAVTRIITPGTVIEDSILEDKANNYLVSIFADENCFGLACCDISTGEYRTGEFESHTDIISELARIAPSEILVPANVKNAKIEQFAQFNNAVLHKTHEYYFWLTKAKKILDEHFNIVPLADQELAMCAAGALLAYIKDTQKIDLQYIKSIQKFNTKEYLELDHTTIKNLELLKRISDGKKEGTLLSVLDHTKTNMGGRMIKQWLLRPLRDQQKIIERHEAVSSFLENTLILEEIREQLSQIGDIERLLSRLTYGQANARDVVTLKHSLTVLPGLHAILTKKEIESRLLSQISQFIDCSAIVQHIDQTLKDECPLTIKEGNFIKQGHNKELDELWSIKNNAKEFLAKLESDEKQKTGISTLKIKYNKVFGYFIEITKRFSDQVPHYYTRKQSTINAERYITDELKELEVKILSAEDKIKAIEYSLFMELCEKIKTTTSQLQQNAQKVATLDCLASFAMASSLYRYRQPRITTNYDFTIQDARHPVVELQEERFITNNCQLTKKERMMIITGPNMAGKSTYMRQIALIIIMAQMGCFIPCTKATISITNKIFTRVGAYDDVTQGRSTFMVEMIETAHILHNATEHSFIVFDEIGSGTSTFDGVAIAWAVATDIARRIKAKTLFSSHYHVLTKLEQEPGIVNYNAAVLEKDDKITFLRKIVRGGTDRSYGLYVAELAGVPKEVVDAAKKIQLQLENDDTMHERIVVEKRPIAQRKDQSYSAYSKVKQKRLFE